MLNKCLILLCCALLGACSTLYSKQSDVLRSVNDFVAQSKFEAARSTITKTNPGHPQYKQLQQRYIEIEGLQKAYFKDLETNIKNLVKKTEYVEANALIKKEKSKNPNDKSLRNIEKQFNKQLAQYQQKFYDEILVNRAKFLLASKPHQLALLKSNPTDSATKSQYNQFLKESKSTGDKLFLISRKAESQKNDEFAYMVMQLSFEIYPTKENSQSFVKMRRDRDIKQKEQARLAKIKADNYKKAISKKANFWEDQFETALKNNNVNQAVLSFEELKKLKKATFTQQKRLDVQIQYNVDQGLSYGKRLYTQGLVSEALNVWLALQKLKPENIQLKEYIERAQKFEANVQRLSNKKAANQ